MSGARAPFALPLLLLLALAPAFAAPAHADEAPADTTVEGYVRSMADSTDRFFGITAQPTDTTGLDSLRTYFVTHPRAHPRRRNAVSISPVASFNRVLGFAPGGGIAFGSARWLGRIGGVAQWAMGPDLWLGGGDYVWSRVDPAESPTWDLRVHVGRDAPSMDRDYSAPGLSTLYAFFAGADRSHYLRRDGALLDFSHAAPGWSAGLIARDQLESPLATTATWYVGGHEPVVVHNDPALLAHVHELGAWAVVRLPRLPYQVEGHAWRAGAGLGGDVAYTRWRASVGGAVALGRHLTLATQTGYGRLTGTALPQEAFYVGGPNLYTIPEHGLQGTGRALGRAELLLTDPVQSLVGLQARPSFPIQLGVFAGSAAAWGFDPVTGFAQLTTRGPERNDWRSEAGCSVMYRPGLPDPDSFVRLVFAWPIGADDRTRSISMSYTRALGFLTHR